MDRKRRVKLKDIIQKISQTANVEEERRVIYSVIGFLPISEGVDNSLLIANLGYVLSQHNLNTCIIDFKVFSPTLYQYLDVEANKRGNGLLRLLKSDKEEVKTQINPTKFEKLYLVSPSPYDRIEEYFDFDFKQIETVINELKGTFDIILIDIPNNPPLEFCMGAMNQVHRGFLTAAQRLEATINVNKIFEFAESIGISTGKFNNAIFVNTQEIEYDYESLKDIGIDIIAKLPLLPMGIDHYLKGELYMKDSSLFNKEYVNGLNKIADIIMS